MQQHQISIAALHPHLTGACRTAMNAGVPPEFHCRSHAGQAEVAPQGRAFVFGAEEAAAAELGDDEVDEVLDAVRQVRGRECPLYPQ